MDAWHVLHLVDRKKFSSYWRFAFQHAGARKSEPWEFGRYQIEQRCPDPAKLVRMTAPYVIRREKRDHLDLPPITHQTVPLVMTGTQQRIYHKMETQMFAEIAGKTVLATNLLARLARLKQIAVSPYIVSDDGWPEGDVPDLADVEEVKFQWLLDVCRGTHHKIVAFSQFERAVSLLGALFEANDIGYTRYTGASQDKRKKEGLLTRDQNEADFKREDGPQVMLATYAAGATGLNWTCASVCVLLDKWWVNDTHEQAWSRLDRSGQRLPVTVYHPRVENSLELWLEDKLDWQRSITEQAMRLLAEEAQKRK